MKKLKFKLSFVFVFLTTMLWADPPGLPQPGTTNINAAPGSVGAPLDDGAVVLLFLALIYGLYKLYKHRRILEKTNPE